MKNKTVIIAGITIGLAGLGFFLWRKNKSVSVDGPKEALERVKNMFGPEIAKNVERIYRLETRNFDSEQYRKTFSAGQEAVEGIDKYPYGWNDSFWNKYPTLRPIGLVGMNDVSGTYARFIKYPNVTAGMLYLGDFLRRYNNNPGRWFTTNDAAQKTYNEKIASITPLLTISLG